MRDKLQEILEHEFKRNTIRGTERVDKDSFMAEVTPKLLDLLDKSLKEARIDELDKFGVFTGFESYQQEYTENRKQELRNKFNDKYKED